MSASNVIELCDILIRQNFAVSKLIQKNQFKLENFQEYFLNTGREIRKLKAKLRKQPGGAKKICLKEVHSQLIQLRGQNPDCLDFDGENDDIIFWLIQLGSNFNESNDEIENQLIQLRAVIISNWMVKMMT